MQLATAHALQGGGRAMVLRAHLPLVRQGAKMVWIDLAFEGSWDGHPNGPFTFDRKVFEQCVRNFEAQANPIPLDYEHTTEWATQAPAAGWIQRLEIRGTRLWALAELTDKAAEQIRSGEYRFSSGVFDFGAIDRKTGKPMGCRLRSAALTNNPFIDGQTPIALSQRRLADPAGSAAIEPARTKYTRAALASGAHPMAAKVSKADLAELVKRMQGEEASMEQIEAILCGIAAERGDEETPDEPEEVVEPPPGDVPPMTDPALAAPPPAPALSDAPGAAAPLADPAAPSAPMAPDPAQADPAVMVATKLMELTGLDAAALLAALEQNGDAIKAAVVGGAASQAPVPNTAPLSDRERIAHSESLSLRDESIRSLKSDNDAMRLELADVRKASAERAVEALLVAGKAVDAQKPLLLAMALNDRKRFDEYVATAPQIVPTAPHALAVTPPADPNSVLVDEADPFVKQLRQNLGGAGIKGKALEDAIRAGVRNKRNKNGAPARA